ncbi:hypothetical protein BD410DRAFT_808618 [Rickenella mellea]|uniref:F-box domain-containing protein n=1 Tax=Rickenella mellea TaxID=50990 RepID=A0A4Y7PLF2_9AGAM|nr:hypothetical protein BD410DRAFT_808618 [Rickenella mellea]
MSEDGYLMFPRPSVHRSPLVLGRVCRLWREISLMTPSLWCRIQLGDLSPTLEGYPSPRYRRDLGRDSVTLREWLRRSGNCPLSIGICYQECHETEIDFITKTNEVAILYIHRWKHFTSHLPPALFSWNVIFPILETAKPVLEGLHLIAAHCFEESDSSSSHFKPHHIVPSMGDSASMILTGHHNIRSLVLTSAMMNLERFKLCISHCPLLEKVEVVGHNDPSLLTAATFNPAYTLLHLTQIDLGALDGAIGPFLDVLSCPVLERILVAQGLYLP